MNIIPKDFTLHGLLNNPNEQFIIPSYQRRYAWRFNQQAALFKDIDMLINNDGHLFGMLILHTGYYHGGINNVNVVDGQQRLTTISILLFSLFKKFEEIDNINNYNNSQILQMLYCGNPDEFKTKILLGELDNNDFQNLLKSNFDKIQNKRILEAFQTFNLFIDEGIKKNGNDWLNNFFQKLIHTAKIIRLDVLQAQDAYKLFETINNRGLKLSSTDILKNFILGHAAKISEIKLKSTIELWSELIISLDGIPSDDFFRQYISSIYTRKISHSKLIEEFKKHYFKNVKEVDKLGEYRYNYGLEDSEELFYDDDFEEEIIDENDEIENELIENKVERIDIEDFLKQIVKAAKCYSKIWFKRFDELKINRKISDLQSIKSFPSYIYLMHYLQTNKSLKEKLRILDFIATLMLRRHMTGKSTAYNDDIFAKLLRIDFNEPEYLEKIKHQLLEDYPDDDEFEIRFSSHELKQRVLDRARYILTQIEYYKTGNTNELSINTSDVVHVEHIIPQKISTRKSKIENGDWEEYLGDKSKVIHKQKVNRIGNMTLLSGSLNISAYNNPFARKKKCYRESNISITKELADYPNFKFYHLDKRGEELAKIAIKIWKI